MHQEALDLYSHHLRVRICGICIQNDKILLAKHHALQEEGYFWAPPGGGLLFGEPVEIGLEREFLEETGLIVKMGKLIVSSEYLSLPLHAIELFFETLVVGGTLKQGVDPEMNLDNQLIAGIAFLSLAEIQELSLSTQVKHRFHKVLQGITDINQLKNPIGWK